MRKINISKKTLRWLTVPGLVVVVNSASYAEIYLTIEQAKQVIFPDETLTNISFVLTDAQCKEILKKSGISVRRKEVKAWRTSQGDYLIVDEVLGKHEYITYAVGINYDGGVRQIEIMDYRETYGYQIKNKDWRDQFVGKKSNDPFKLNQDIKNISGATLSCRHVADGVKRVLALYELVLSKQQN
ncbi:MAG: FMN-binding protein [Chlamydiae bacterium]|nr:FMN-binding protein [Chlamydiota bacterium]MBI3276306.1 FMN-binding protein [Chlamydiota bacterium]